MTEKIYEGRIELILSSFSTYSQAQDWNRNLTEKIFVRLL